MSVEGGSAGGGVGGGVAGAAPVVVNAGLVRSLEGFRPMNISDITTIDRGGTIVPLGQIIFKPGVPSVLEQAEAVAAKAWEATELNGTDATTSLRDPDISVGTKQSNSAIKIAASSLNKLGTPRNDNFIMSQVEPVILPLVEPALALQVSPALEPVAKTGLSPKLEKSVSKEKRVSYQVAPAISLQPFPQEQVVEEEVVEKVEQVEPKDSLEEEEEIEKTNRKFVVDERALSQVVLEIKEAARKAGALAGKLGIKITGKLIGSFLPVQHPGNESEAVKGKGSDGSIPERQQTIEKQGEYISVVQAEENAVLVAYAQPPIKIRSEGESVEPEDVDRVFRAHVAKPKAVAVEITRKRVVKKQVQVAAGSVVAETKPKTETSLEDYPELAEVFEKAA